MDVRARGNVLECVLPTRYILSVMGSIGMAIIYALRVNLSVAMVGMLNHTALKGMSDHTAIDPKQDGKFIWSSDIQGLVLSCYFWGYIVSQLPGGRLAEMYSARWVIFSSVALNAVCTLLSPVMIEIHYVGLMVMRILEGIGGGATFPAMHVLLSKWAPATERGLMSCIVYAGISLGTVVSILMAGLLSANIGWESVFYVMGGLSLIWCIVWIILVQDNPQLQPFISLKEREMIISSLGGHLGEKPVDKKIPVPWRALFTSPPFYAIVAAHSCSNWGWYMLLIELPFYMKQVLKFNLTENALATSLPYLSLWLFSIIFSKSIEILLKKEILSITTVRKIGTITSSGFQSLSLLILCFVENRIAAVAIMAFAITIDGTVFVGFLTNHIDIAPNFAGTLMGLTNTIGTIPGIIVPIFVGAVTKHDKTISAWRIIFLVTIGFYLVEIVVYAICGSGEEQPWNRAHEKKKDERRSP